MKEKIIQTAVDLVQEYGVKFTLSDIASNAGISKKTIYKYFDSKEALLRAVVDYVFEDIRRQHQKILKQDLPNVEKLRRIVCVYPEVIRFDSIKLDKLIELHPEIYARINAQFRDNWDLTFALYEECVKEGSIRNIDKQYFRIILLGIFDQAIHTENHEETTNVCIDAIFDGFVNRQKGNAQ